MNTVGQTFLLCQSLQSLLNIPGSHHLELHTFKNGIPVQGTIPFEESDYQTWYNNIGDHLLRGGDLMVKPEEARRVIGIIECAEKSSATGKAVKVPYEE